MREEIGPAKQEELDAVLKTMCLAFEMPYLPARRIFYADPFLNHEDKIVLRQEGAILSCLSLVPRLCHIGPALVPLAGIAGVATLPGHRREGLAGRLLAHTGGIMAERGFALSALLPAENSFYTKRGWAEIQNAPPMLISRADLSTLPPAEKVRRGREHDIEQAASLYERHTRGRPLCCLRERKQWDFLLQRGLQFLVHEAEEGHLDGYMLCRFQPGRALSPNAAEPVHQAVEIHADTLESCCSLLAWLTSQPDGDHFEVELLPGSESETLVQQLFPGPRRREGNVPFLVRIVHFTRLLDMLCANWGHSRAVTIGLSLRSAQEDVFSPAALLHLGPEGAKVEPVTCSRAEAEPVHIYGDGTAWVFAATGSSAVAELIQSGLLAASCPEAAALCGKLFPLRNPVLTRADYF